MRARVTEPEIRRMVAGALAARLGVPIDPADLRQLSGPDSADAWAFDGYETADIPLSGGTSPAGGDVPPGEYEFRPAPERPGPPQASPAAPTASAVLTIEGSDYFVSVVPDRSCALVRKIRAGGAGDPYRVAWTADPEKAAGPGPWQGWECTCGDFAYRHGGPAGDGRPCKHLRTLGAAGLLPTGAIEALADPDDAAERVLGRLGWSGTVDTSPAR